MDYITKLSKETDSSIYKYNGLDFRLLILKLEEELERLSREYRDEFDKL